MYTDDVSDALNKSLYGCIAGDRVVSLLMYADNHVMFCQSAWRFIIIIIKCELYDAKHDIKYNAKKSAVIICRNSFVKNAGFFSHFPRKGETIKDLSSFKYLGHIICNDMNDDTDIMKQHRQFYAQETC